MRRVKAIESAAEKSAASNTPATKKRLAKKRGGPWPAPNEDLQSATKVAKDLKMDGPHPLSSKTVTAVATDRTAIFYREVSLYPSVADPKGLTFIAAMDAPKPPDDLLLLRQEYERTARIVSVLFEDEPQIRKEIFLLMHEAADRGIRGSAFSIEDGRANLVGVRETILDNAHKVRSKRLREYTVLLVLFGVIPLILGAIVLLTGAFGLLSKPGPGERYDPLFAWIIAAFWIPAGAAICVWGEFALRMQAGLSYEKLLNLDPSRWRPAQRLLITVGVSFIFAFLLAYDAIQVGLGNVLLNDFAKNTPAMGLAVGGITGLAFATVQDIIYRVKPNVK